MVKRTSVTGLHNRKFAIQVHKTITGGIRKALQRVGTHNHQVMSAESRNRIVVSVEGANQIISFTVYHEGETRQYHVTYSSDTKHITKEGDRDHYGFRTEPKAGSLEWDIIDQKMTKKEKGKDKKKFHVFSELPQPEQNWFKEHYGELLEIEAGEQKTYYL